MNMVIGAADKEKTRSTEETGSIKATFKADTFINGGSNIALLNSNNTFDSALFIQSIIDLGITMKTPEDHKQRNIIFHLTARANSILGSPETTQLITPELVRIGHTVTEFEHAHAVDRSLLWIREAWIKIYSDSQNGFFQCGCFPKKIGQGLILGNRYRIAEIHLESLVDQYRPGIQYTTQLKNPQNSITAYLGFEKITSTSVEQQIGMTRSQELQELSQNRYTRKEQPSLQNSFLLSIESSHQLVEKSSEQGLTLKVSPFLLYQRDPNQTIEFFADAACSTWTGGACVDFEYKRFFGSIDCAVQAGVQRAKAWDRNTSRQEGTKKLTHLFSRPNAGTAWEESAVFPTDADVSLSYDSGVEFAATSPEFSSLPAFNNFKNSYSRFRKAYQNNLSGILIAADCGYTYSNHITFGAILGIISGDDSPNNSEEESTLYRLDSNWSSVRQDRKKSYGGFHGIDSLYTGKSVHSQYLLKSNRVAGDITAHPELLYNSCSNLAYLGVSMKYQAKTKRSDKKWFVQPNMILLMQTHRVEFGYDPTVFDTYEPATILPSNELFANAHKKMPGILGLEMNSQFEFYDSDHLTLYGSLSFFFPGSHYHGIKNASYNRQGRVIPLKNQLDGEQANLSGIETRAQNTVTLLDHVSMSCYVGCEINFDSIAAFFSGSSKPKK